MLVRAVWGTTANRSHPYPSWVIHVTLKSAQLPAARNRVEPLQTGKQTLRGKRVAGDQMLLPAPDRRMGESTAGGQEGKPEKVMVTLYLPENPSRGKEQEPLEWWQLGSPRQCHTLR